MSDEVLGVLGPSTFQNKLARSTSLSRKSHNDSTVLNDRIPDLSIANYCTAIRLMITRVRTALVVRIVRIDMGVDY